MTSLEDWRTNCLLNRLEFDEQTGQHNTNKRINNSGWWEWCDRCRKWLVPWCHFQWDLSYLLFSFLFILMKKGKQCLRIWVLFDGKSGQLVVWFCICIHWANCWWEKLSYSNTLPQPEHRSSRPISFFNLLNSCFPRFLVNKSTIISVVLQCFSDIRPSLTFSLIQWNSISMCLDRPWNTGLLARYMALRLSLLSVMGSLMIRPSSFMSLQIHIISCPASVVARYSASVVDSATVCCSRLLQLMAPLR